MLLIHPDQRCGADLLIMPGLFSRKSKPKQSLSPLGGSKTYTGAISSADIDRLGLSSPTPSTADAHLLPSVPTKDDLPTLPPKDAPRNATLPPSSTASNGTTSEFGRLQDAPPPRPATLASSSTSVTNTRLLHPSNALHTVTPRSSLNHLPSNAPSSYTSDVAHAIAQKPPYAYGYSTEGWHIQLEAARVLALLEACGEQIRSRGLDNPLIFSSMALDLSPTNVASLIRLFATTQPLQRALPPAFLDEIRYANPHDLAALIKWGLARMGRVLAVPVPVPGQKKGEVREEMVYVHQRGFLDLEAYNAWRDHERRSHYSHSAFDHFLAHLAPDNARLLSALFELLSSTASYSLKNGMMPAKLCKHFGPLLFGLPEDESFARTYDAYVRASNATEHLLLAYIRLQATKAALPPRLAQHVNGYPSMLPTEITSPSPSSKLVPVTQIERNVRLYTIDLVQSACEIDLAEACPEWRDCCDTYEAIGRDPQLSDKFRKLVNLRGGAIQGRKPGSSVSTPAAAEDDDAVAAHGSLVSKRWDDFLSDGFGAPDSSKLAFDLKESARRNRTVKRQSMQWTDFSKDGFHASDSDALADALSFDESLKHDVQNWPSERDQLHAKLKARQDKLPPFHYDTTPRLLASPSLAGTPQGKLDAHPISRMDETFADVWADFLLGSGWSNRDELTHRNANFVVVQYKSRPNASTVGSQSAGSSLSAPTRFQVSSTRKDESVPRDERIDAAWFVVQEVVPAQYRAELEAAGRGTSKGRAMIRKLTMFRSRKERERGSADDKSADTTDDVFRPGPGGSTKRILLSDQLRKTTSRSASRSSLRSHASADRDAEMRVSSDTPNMHAQYRSEGHTGGSKLISTLRAKSMRVVKGARRGASSPALSSHVDEFGAGAGAGANGARSRVQQGDLGVDRSFTSADFETRSVADGAEERDSMDSLTAAASRRHTPAREDAWIDILVRANGTRMTGQDAPPPRKGSLGLPVSADRSAIDETAQLSVPEVGTEASTPRSAHMPLSGSDETLEGASGVPRSSTPPLSASAKATPETDHAAEMGLGLERIDTASSHGDDEESHVEVGMRDVSPAPQAAPRIDPVAAARAALKSRREMAPRAPAQIDAKKLVESLRAGLSPIEAVRASKDPRATSPPLSSPTPASPVSPLAGKAGYRDPFAKDPVAGRVADVASRFGGTLPAKKPQVEERSLPSEADEDDEIYPEDAASNIDPREPRSPQSDGLELPEEVETLSEGGARFAQPYQPGMPLDNVLEESESVVSGTTNL